jgi:hypothetical protein
MKPTMKSSVVRRLGLAALPLLLLFLYLAASVQVDTLHHLVHPDDDIALHSPENERDTCHQSIYHGGLDSGCEHKSHLSEFKKCPLCQYATHSVHLYSTPSIERSLTYHDVFEDIKITGKAGDISIHRSSRAPPFHSLLSA